MAFRSIGLEIGTSAIRAAELTVGSEIPVLHNFAEFPLPPGAVIDGEVAQKQLVTDRLKRLWEEADFSTNRVTVGVAGLRAIIREIEVPPISEKELDQAVLFQAQDVIPFQVDKALLSAVPVGNVTKPDGTTLQKVLVYAAHRDLVEPVISIIRNAGLSVIRVDLSANGLVRAVRNQVVNPAATEAIVSFGAGVTLIVVYSGGIPLFVRTIGIGGDKITEAISSTLDAPFEDAEQIKWNLQLPGPQYSAAQAAVRDAVAPLIGEIRSSVDYYNGQHPENPITRILLTGGGCMLEGFVSRLAQAIPIQFDYAHPLAGVDTSQVGMLPEDLARQEMTMATAIGLSLPDAASIKPVNLLPPEILAEARTGRAKKYLYSVLALIGVLLLILTGLKILDLHNLDNSINNTKTEIAVVNADIARLQAALNRKQEVQSYIQAISGPLKADVNWIQLFNRIVAHNTSTIVATQYSVVSPPAVARSNSQVSTTQITLVSNGKPIPSSDILCVISVNIFGADGYSDFLQWTNSMNSDPWFTTPVSSGIQEVQPGQPPITFTATFGVTNLAAANRLSQITG